MNNRTKTLITIFAVFLLMSAPLLVFPAYNNILLYKFSRQLIECEQPEHTRLLSSAQVCGKLNGNGNGMDFFAVLLVRSKLALAELRKHYKMAGFKPVKDSSQNSCEIQVINAATPIVQSDLLEHRQISFPDQQAPISDGGCYYIILYDGGYSAFFDLRGH